MNIISFYDTVYVVMTYILFTVDSIRKADPYWVLLWCHLNTQSNPQFIASEYTFIYIPEG